MSTPNPGTKTNKKRASLLLPGLPLERLEQSACIRYHDSLQKLDALEQENDELCLSQIPTPSYGTSLHLGGYDYFTYRKNSTNDRIYQMIVRQAMQAVKNNKTEVTLSVLEVLNSDFSVKTESILGRLLQKSKSNGYLAAKINIKLIDKKNGDRYIVKINLNSFLRISISDHSSAPIENHFSQGTDFIKDSLVRDDLTFVFCQKGVNRSTAMVVAYFMRYERMPYIMAINHVSKYRPCFMGVFSTFASKLLEYSKVLDLTPPDKLESVVVMPTSAAMLPLVSTVTMPVDRPDSIIEQLKAGKRIVVDPTVLKFINNPHKPIYTQQETFIRRILEEETKEKVNSSFSLG